MKRQRVYIYDDSQHPGSWLSVDQNQNMCTVKNSVEYILNRNVACSASLDAVISVILLDIMSKLDSI